jgi:hypothetical protein
MKVCTIIFFDCTVRIVCCCVAPAASRKESSVSSAAQREKLANAHHHRGDMRTTQHDVLPPLQSVLQTGSDAGYTTLLHQGDVDEMRYAFDRAVGIEFLFP